MEITPHIYVSQKECASSFTFNVFNSEIRGSVEYVNLCHCSSSNAISVYCFFVKVCKEDLWSVEIIVPT